MLTVRDYWGDRGVNSNFLMDSFLFSSHDVSWLGVLFAV